MVAATFRHDTSRNLDPQHHTHAVIANMVQGADGKWRTMVHQRTRFGTGRTQGSCRNPQDNDATSYNAGGGKSVGHWRLLEPEHADQRRKDHRGFPQG